MDVLKTSKQKKKEDSFVDKSLPIDDCSKFAECIKLCLSSECISEVTSMSGYAA